MPHLSAVPTPCLVVDADRLDANITSMAAHADRLQVALRPHVKTHKSLDIARRQVDAGAAGLTVANLSEALVFARAGFTDLFVAYPLWVDDTKAGALRELVDRATVRVGVDSWESAAQLAKHLSPAIRAQVRALVEVDTGHHRSGAPPEDAGRLAEQVGAAGLEVVGVFTFPGHSYSPTGRVDAAAQEAAGLAYAAESMRSVGLTPQVVSGGSTPSASLVTAGSLTELRPGVYVFGDAQQWELGATDPERIALTCLATVVSHAGGHLVLDSGSKVLGADRASWATGYGRLLDHPDARISQLSEHHAVVELGPGEPLPPLGSRVRVVPNHCCNTVNLADELLVVRDERVAERWPVSARGHNT